MAPQNRDWTKLVTKAAKKKKVLLSVPTKARLQGTSLIRPSSQGVARNQPGTGPYRGSTAFQKLNPQLNRMVLGLIVIPMLSLHFQGSFVVTLKLREVRW